MTVSSNVPTRLSNVVFDNWGITDITGIAKQSLFVGNNANSSVIKRSLNLNIYPNPANKSFSLDFRLEEQENAVVSIIEIGTGRILFTENLLNFSGQYHTLFTDARIPRGNYIVALKTSKDLQTRQLKME